MTSPSASASYFRRLDASRLISASGFTTPPGTAQKPVAAPSYRVVSPTSRARVCVRSRSRDERCRSLRAMPPKSKPLIKGQGSLANYFAGGGITKAEEAPTPPATDSGGLNQAAGGSKGSKKKSGGSTAPEQPPPEIKHLEEKITVRGYTPAKPSPSPQKSKAPPLKPKTRVEDDEAMPSPSKPASRSRDSRGSGKSKYFGKGSGSDRSDAVVIDDEDEDEVAPSRATKSKQTAAAASKRKKADEDDDYADEDEDAPVLKKGPAKSAKSPARATRASRSARGAVDDEREEPQNTAAGRKGQADDDDDDDEPSTRKRKAPAKGSRGSAVKAEPIDVDAEDAQPAKKASTSTKAHANGKGGGVDTTEDDDKAALKAARERAAAGPSAPGSKEIPQGNPDCLAGLTFVFTGQLESLSREDAQSLVKGLGAKVTGGPSSKTSYVVLGEGAGPSKLKTIKSNNLATLDEDGLLNLIRERANKEPDAATKKKLQQEEQKIIKAAKTLEVSAGGAGTGKVGGQDVDMDTQSLWTVKYAPSKPKDLMGNNAQVEVLRDWLENWTQSLSDNFRKPGPSGARIKPAILISGPPGIGKTTAAHLVAKMCGYTPLELNASDTRSKKLIEASLSNVINNKSLDNWYNGGGQQAMEVDGVTITDRTVLILDEVDGMSGGDRGGIGAINAMIKKTKVPIILIANDRGSQKMKPFASTTWDLSFRRPTADSIRARLMTIAFREGLKVDKNGMDQLIAASQSDLRSVINMLSTWKLGEKALSFAESKALGSAYVKPGIGNPFTLYGDLASHGTWSASSKKTLNQKADFYFQEPSLMPLFVQENYVRQQPQVLAGIKDDREKSIKAMQLVNRAAAAISDGDMVDSMIHGSQQHWSLMPLHAAVSTLKPMSLLYGMTGMNSWGPSFPSWLGNYSKQQRLSRATVELQVKMRLSASGSRWEVREHYVPYLFTALSDPLIEKRQDGISDVVDLMDDYYLGTEDRDIVLELGVGKNKGDDVLKKIPKEVKTSFTRTYNQGTHPVAFQKGDPGTAKARAKQLRGDDVPDVEEAIVEDEIFEDESADEMSSDDDVDVNKDKMIKAKKPKATKGKGKSAATTSSPKKRKK
ncbi:unnamed protein product [Parajaminaea phylloscopi]